jgi:hypothetical protein
MEVGQGPNWDCSAKGKKIVTILRQIVTTFNDAVLEEAKIVAIIEIVLNIMEQNGH